MIQWLNDLDTLQTIFALFAGIGSILFLIRMVMMFAGMGGDSEVDGDVAGADGDTNLGDGDSDVSHDADLSFKLLSFQGLTAFFMMFGLVGLAMSKGSGYGAGLSMVVATCAGLAAVWVISQMFKMASRLQSSGTLNLKNAIGEEGTVYLTIQEEEPGKVRLSVQGHLKVMEAVSRDKTKILTDSRVKVVDVINGNVLVVTKI